ncbi:hypothetical protein P2318_14375 [Myxococcaceae bacterium GXIMD 01537]
MDLRTPAPLLALAAVLAAAACSLAVDDGPGHPCGDDSECPDSYVCVPDTNGERVCQVLYPPLPSASGQDGGVDAGPVPTYCQDIQPILAANCTSSCHGADHSSGIAGFRLDYYEPPGGVGEPGARAKADRIKARAADFRTMPPAGNPAPTPAQRVLLARWARGGAPLCNDGGTPDAGTP